MKRGVDNQSAQRSSRLLLYALHTSWLQAGLVCEATLLVATAGFPCSLAASSVAPLLSLGFVPAGRVPPATTRARAQNRVIRGNGHHVSRPRNYHRPHIRSSTCTCMCMRDHDQA